MATGDPDDGGPAPRGTAASPGWRPPGPPPSGASLRTWIEEEAAAAVRAGELSPETRLPSVRRLADRIGVHRNTVRAAYRGLADRGLVRLVQGAGCFVRGTSSFGQVACGSDGAASQSGAVARSGPEDRRRNPPFRHFLVSARQRGATTDEIAAWVRRWERSVRSGRLIVASPEAELGRIWAEELMQGLPDLDLEMEVAAAGPDRRCRSEWAEAPVAALWRAVEELSASLPPWVEVIPLVRAAGRQLRSTAPRLPNDALVLVVSDSSSLRERLLTLLRLVDPTPVAAALSSCDSRRFQRLVRVARLVVTDVVSAVPVAARIGGTRLFVFRDLAPGTSRRVARRLLAPGG